MSIDPDRLSAFQTRMNGWVSSQGLLFQLRHGGPVTGGKSAFASGLTRLLLRGVLLLMVLGVAFWIFLATRMNFGWFKDELGEKVSLALGADSAEVGGVDRVRGQLVIAKMVLEGGEESFFGKAQLWGARTTMGLADGLLTPWNGGKVLIKELDLYVKSGADTKEDASKAFQSLFRAPDQFQFSGVEVEKATVRWGYSPMHRGSIRDSRLVATRLPAGGWKMVFTGGLFSQNWLRRLEIERIEVNVTPESIVFEDMSLKQDTGEITMRLEVVEGGARPRLQGAGSIKSMPVWSLVDPEFREFIDGEFSGTFTVQGSMNSQEGIGVEVQVKLDEGDKIELRDRFSLFSAISLVDRFRSYKKVRFATGRFTFRTGGGVMELSDAWLSAPDLMRIEGGFLVRPSTEEEAANPLNVDQRATVGGMHVDQRPGEGQDVDDFSLKKAGKAYRKGIGEESSRSIILDKQLGTGDTRELEVEALEREKEPFLEGKVRLGLLKEAFDRSPALAEEFPVDPQEGVRWVDVPMNGTIYSVGVDQARELILRSREGR